MDKIMVCKELSWSEDDNNKVHFYRVPEEWGESVGEGGFIYLVGIGTEKLEFAIGQIIKIDDFINVDEQLNVEELSEDKKIYHITEEYFLTPVEKDIQEHGNDSIKELSKFLNILIKGLDIEMFFIRRRPLNNKRKEYLLKLFYYKSVEEFYKQSQKDKNQWFREYNGFELDFVHMVNVYKLKGSICQLIETNKTISENDKVVLKKEYSERLDILVSSIGHKGITRYKENKIVGIDLSSDGKSIILGKFTPLELYINLFSFWNMVKSLLTISFIPILVGLLASDKKIIIYSLLGVVYLITLILSDEKQVDNIVAFMNQVKLYKYSETNYYALFYFGAVALLVFVIFSIQVLFLPNMVNGIGTFAMYLIGDILFAFVVLLGILTVMELFFYLIATIRSKIFYIKRSKKFSAIFLLCFKIIFWAVSVCCIYNILGINKYLFNNPQALKGELFVFPVALIFSFQKIWQAILEFKEKIKSNYERV